MKNAGKGLMMKIEITKEETGKIISDYLFEQYSFDLDGKKWEIEERFGGWVLEISDRLEGDKF